MERTYRCGIVYADEIQSACLSSMHEKLEGGWIKFLVSWDEINQAQRKYEATSELAARQFHALAFLQHDPLSPEQTSYWGKALLPYRHAWGVMLSNNGAAVKQFDRDLTQQGFMAPLHVRDLTNSSHVAQALGPWLADTKDRHNNNWITCPNCNNVLLIKRHNQHWMTIDSTIGAVDECDVCEKLVITKKRGSGKFTARIWTSPPSPKLDPGWAY